MPPWPRGRVIEDLTGWLARLTILVQVGSLVVAYLFPKLSPDGPQLASSLLTICWAVLVGSIWIALRLDRIELARAASALNGLIVAGLILFVVQKNIRSGDHLGPLEGLAVYGFGTCLLVGFYFAYREITAEIGRRSQATP